MKSREELFEEAFAQKEQMVSKRKAEQENKMQILKGENSRICEIETEMSKLGADITVTVFSGDKKRMADIRLKMTELENEKNSALKNAGIEFAGFECEKCEDTGYVSGKICDCIKDRVKKLRLEELSNELPIKDCRFDNFDLNYYPTAADENNVSPRKRMTGILKLCREYVLNFDPKASENLLFMGEAGLGKTHLTLAMVADVTARGFDVFYGSAGSIFSSLENEHFNQHDDTIKESILSCDLLVIDDLGSEFASPYTKSVLYEIVNGRLLSGQPTVINTNLSMSDIEKIYTARVASRLIGEYTAKRFCGNDIRQLRAIERAKKS